VEAVLLVAQRRIAEEEAALDRGMETVFALPIEIWHYILQCAVPTELGEWGESEQF
jgi:hypothetical protein